MGTAGLLFCALALLAACGVDVVLTDGKGGTPIAGGGGGEGGGPADGGAAGQGPPPLCPLPATPPRLADWVDAFAVMADATAGNCGAGNCHGVQSAAGAGAWLPYDDPSIFYDTLISTFDSAGRRVVDRDFPLRSGLPCLVRSHVTLSLSQDALDVIDAWILRGAEGPGR
jgi:hypothetical protein